MKSHRPNKQGFTLIEVLIAMLVISIAVMGVLLTFTKSNQMMIQLRELSIADQCVKEEIESIRDMNYNEILNLTATFTAAGFVYLDNPVGTRVLDDPFADPDIRRVTVSVSWESVEGRQLDCLLS